MVGDHSIDRAIPGEEKREETQYSRVSLGNANLRVCVPL